MSDRFARFKTDPRFRRPKKQTSKVQIDARFRDVIDSKPVKGASRVDKYGRKLATTHEKDQLRKFYSLDDEEEDEKEKRVDYARGEGLLESSSSSSSDEEEEDEGDVVIGGAVTKPIHLLDEESDEQEPEIDLDESQFAELDAEAEKNVAADAAATGEAVKPTKRIAAVNLDWDHVKASHLFRIFSSALISLNANATTSSLKSGRLLNVSIYPSEFGKKKMAEEDKSGPPPELFQPPADGKKRRKQDEGNKHTKVVKRRDDGEEYDQNALRTYQLERLRYYYAIATFTDVAAASHVYTELEGTELERSANLFDLSYVPDSMAFEDPPRDEATEESLTASYQPLNFTTDALRHSNVKLTWDDDDPERTRVTRRALSKKEIDEMDFQALIASSSSSDDEASAPNGKSSKKAASKEEAQRIRTLLLSGNDENLPEGWGGQSIEKEGESGAMEITFTPGLSGTLGSSANAVTEETTLERYQRKEKEKKKAKKAKRKEKLAAAAADATSEEDIAKKGSRSRKLEGDAFFANSSEDEPDAEEGAHSRKQRSTAKPATDAELSLLMDDDEGLLPSGRKHFDMNDIIRAEKRSDKGHKSKSTKRKRREGEHEEDKFEMDVQDPRFRAVLDDHRFAIDPANPHFKKTKNMKRLLQAKGGGDYEARHQKRKRR